MGAGALSGAPRSDEIPPNDDLVALPVEDNPRVPVLDGREQGVPPVHLIAAVSPKREIIHHLVRVKVQVLAWP